MEQLLMSDLMGLPVSEFLGRFVVPIASISAIVGVLFLETLYLFGGAVRSLWRQVRIGIERCRLRRRKRIEAMTNPST
ncbi:hypothetical protein [Pandoraea communis]|uniref:hypothetical protein n=1 Tax=Pandoraea communis TaxID=2508297 RepID=UPI0025A61FC0|nr:hypothetical protein [Pandoraea communis]MDM8356040.1 hypothetical protein [Pandoraea communis]